MRSALMAKISFSCESLFHRTRIQSTSCAKPEEFTRNGAHEAVGFSLGDLRSKREKGYMKRNRYGNEEPKKSGA